MKLSEYAIDRPRAVLMATVLVVFIAILAALDTPVQRTPAITKAVILVAVPYPGAQPTEVEEQITRTIEDELRNLGDVDFIASTSMRGSSVTQVVFLDGVDADEARGEVQDLVDRVRSELPLGREVQPVVRSIDFENTPLMLVNITPPDGFDERALKQLAEEVQDELEGIPGVANTQLFGGRDREIHVNINVDRASQHGLTISDFHRTLSDFHSELPGGSLDTGSFDFQVRNETKFRGVEDIREAVLRQEEGRVLRVGDVADVEDTYRRMQNVAHLDGKECATIIVNKEADINTLAAAQAIKSRVDDLRHQYPSIKFSTTRDTSEEISLMFRVLGSSFVFGAMLVLIILSWTMGLRISILVLMAIPFSSAVGLSFLYFYEIPVSNMVIFSFILVLGMVVDGAIIVAENIHRHVELGEDPVTASKIGIREVGMPVIMADLTTIAAYLPMLLVPGIMGDFMSVMPKVVSVTLLGSVLVDHFVIPALAAQWYKQRTVGEGANSARAKLSVDSGSDTDPAEYRRRRPNHGWMTRAYGSVLGWSLGNRWAIISCVTLGFVWAGFTFLRLGFDFFPPSDRGQFEVKYELPLGTSIDQTVAAAAVFTDPLSEMQADQRQELVHFVSALGSSEGLASRLENDPAVGPEFGTVMVQLKSPLDRERHEDLIIDDLRARFDREVKRVPGIKYTIEEVEEGPPGGADVAVRFTGESLDALGATAKQVAARLRNMPGTEDATTDYRDENPEIVVVPRPELVAMYDIPDAQLSRAIQTAILGDTTIELNLGDEDVTLRLQASSEYQQSVESIKKIMLTSPSGRRATVGELADLRRTNGLYSVNRYEHERAVVARCDVTAGTSADDVFAELRNEILPALDFRPIPPTRLSGLTRAFREDFLPRIGVRLPEAKAVAFLGNPGTPMEGMRASFTGENEERDENFGYLLRCMGIAVVLIFAILVWQFNSFRQALLVMVTVPLSFIGVIAGMWICGFPFSLASFIGLVALTGVVVNDAIVVVDFINQARRRGLPLREAVMEAGMNRFRPVILTTVTTIGGLLPLFGNLSGGAEFWQPLTGAIIFGLAIASILTLLVVPVGYSLLYRVTQVDGVSSAGGS